MPLPNEDTTPPVTNMNLVIAEAVIALSAGERDDHVVGKPNYNLAALIARIDGPSKINRQYAPMSQFLQESIMSTSLYSVSIPVLKQGLNNLSAILDKAVAHVEANKIDPIALLNFRLYPDMLPFTKQIQIATDHAKGCAARLSGVEIPKFEDNEASFADLKARIAKTVAFLESVDRGAVDSAADKEVIIPIRDRKLHMKGNDYLTKMVFPNFYFHLTTAYAILRHNGIPIGKIDFVGPL